MGAPPVLTSKWHLPGMSKIMWSHRNESLYGRTHLASEYRLEFVQTLAEVIVVYDSFIKAFDTTMLINSEADGTAQAVDIFNRLYTSCEEIIKFATQSETWDKPLIMQVVHILFQVSSING
ncbi:hypothetical protein BJ878DRAFT_250575 [Calycina marina]|uniref:Uncharacterized protein n=1 Tax=Calycina marina TaxID=1763456 RepID=A0A9P8CHK2_9HELO|nr:hypothetical protein BJ878DRAFT_250575 [Calycina marina]